MNRINKAILLPIVAVLVMILKSSGTIQIDDTEIDKITDAIISIIALWGIFEHPVKKDNEGDHHDV